MKNVIPQNAPLSAEDSETQTKGCRHTNPDICGNNGLDRICAFVRSDGICKRPPRSWNRIFKSLKKGELGD